MDDQTSFRTSNFDYGREWIVGKDDVTSLRELVSNIIIYQGDNAVKLRYLKKSL